MAETNTNIMALAIVGVVAVVAVVVLVTSASSSPAMTYSAMPSMEGNVAGNAVEGCYGPANQDTMDCYDTWSSRVNSREARDDAFWMCYNLYNCDGNGIGR